MEIKYREGDRICRKPDAERITGLSAKRIDDLVRAGEFPKPMKLGARAVGWFESTLREATQRRLNELNQ